MYITDNIPYTDLESGLAGKAGGEGGLSSMDRVPADEAKPRHHKVRRNRPYAKSIPT